MAIVGVVVSTFVQFMKSTANLQGWKTLLVLIATSLAAGAFYFYFSNTEYWQSFIKILVFANAVYGVLISRFEK